MLCSLEPPYALLVCNGSVPDSPRLRYLAGRARCIVCADGGANRARHLGLRADVVLGDFDSVDPDTLEHYHAAGARILRMAGQDDTDFEKGLAYLEQAGERRIAVAGITGGLLDHTFGNMSILLRHAVGPPAGSPGNGGTAGGVGIVIFDEHYRIDVVTGTTWFPCRRGGRVSVVPLPRAVGVRLAGLEYPLRRETLAFGEREGTCNRALRRSFTAGCRSGALLVFRELRW